MSDIQDKEIKKRFQRIVQFHPNPKQIAHDLQRTRETILRQQTDKQPARLSNLWRTIMKSKLTKLATAAMIILVIMGSINLFDRSVSSAFAMEDIWAATAKTEWVHMTWQYTDPDLKPNDEGKQLLPLQLTESWISVKPHRRINIQMNRKVIFVEYDDEAGHINTQTYDPQSNSIRSHHRRIIAKRKRPATIADIFSDFSRAEEKGAKVGYTDGFHGGLPVKLINVAYPEDDNGVRGQYSLIVDVDTYLPISMNSIRENLESELRQM